MVRLLLLLVLSFAPVAAQARTLTIFAAASLTEALRDAAALWARAGHPPPTLYFGSSSTLARQIEQGAPADLFASADEQWMDYLDERRLIVPETRRGLFGNELVLIVPSDRPTRVAISPALDLTALLGPGGRLAVGDPAHVPAGIYAEQALSKLGLWDRAAPRLARAEDVRAALLLVERGEASAGIVYATDALASKGVRMAGTFAADTHDPIVYPFAVTEAGDTPEARAFLAFLAGEAAREAFARRGFKVE